MNLTTQPTFALSLSGGGARAAYQAGVLCGLSEFVDSDFPFKVITGVSAGAINASPLAASTRSFKQETTMLADSWRRIRTDNIFKTNIGCLSWSLFRWLWMLTSGQSSNQVKGLFNTSPLQKFLAKSFNPEDIQANINADRLRALAISTTCYDSGETITFVQGNSEVASWKRARRQSLNCKINVEHVMASSALPILFPAIEIGGGYYGDGSLRQYSPLAPAVHLGANKILVVSLYFNERAARSKNYSSPHYPTPAQIMGLILHGVFLDALDHDMERLDRINRTAKKIADQGIHQSTLRPIELLKIAPSVDLGKLAYEHRKLLPYTIRQMTRGLGSSDQESADFISYLLFERPYIERLLEIGYSDAKAQRDNIKKFFESLAP